MQICLGKTSYFSCFPVNMSLGVPRRAHATRNIWQTRNTGFMHFPSDDDRFPIVVIKPLYVWQLKDLLETLSFLPEMSSDSSPTLNKTVCWWHSHSVNHENQEKCLNHLNSICYVNQPEPGSGMCLTGIRFLVLKGWNWPAYVEQHILNFPIVCKRRSVLSASRVGSLMTAGK